MTTTAMDYQKHNKAWVCVFRTGGTENFVWQPTAHFATEAEADAAATEIRKGGRPCYVYDAYDYERIGGPETYEYPSAPK